MTGSMRALIVCAVTSIALSVVAAARPAPTPPGFGAIVKVPGSERGSEPSMAIDEHGMRYVSWQSPGSVAASKDGIHFADPVKPAASGTGDVTTAVDAFGAVYNGEFCNGATTLHACVYKSTDGGKTWPQKGDLADNHPGAADRPWIDVYPHHFAPYPGGADVGTPATTDETTVYVEYHTFSPEDLVYVTVSTDGGKTFSLPKLPGSDTNALNGSGCNTVPGGIATDDRTGNAYALWVSGEDVAMNVTTGCNISQIGPFTKAWVSVTKDSGATWQTHLVWQGAFDPVTRIGDNASKLFPAIAVDRGGQVHVMMPVRRNDDPLGLTASCNTTGCTDRATKTDLVLVTSPDEGDHWTPPLSINPSGGSNFFPWIAAGAPGVVDAVYYRSPTLEPNEAASLWHVGFSQITGAVARIDGDAAVYESEPAVTSGLVSPKPAHEGGICTFGLFCEAVTNADRTLADSIVVALDPNGGANMAWTANYPAGSERRIEFACQTSGMGAYGHALSGCDTEAAAAAKPPAKPPAVVKGVKRPLPATGIGDSPAAPLALLVAAMGAAVALRRLPR